MRVVRFVRILPMLAVLLWPAALTAGERLPPVSGCQGRDLIDDIRARDGARERIEIAAAAARNGRAILWRITRPGVGPSYLFGTIHLSDPRVTRLPDAVTAALSGAHRLVLEVADISPGALVSAIGRLRTKVFFEDGRSLGGLLTPEEHDKAREVAGRAGLPDQILATARPWLVTMMMAMTACERARMTKGALPLDLALARSARERGIPVLGLETLEDQLAAMAAVPEADQLTMLRASLRLDDRAEDMVETIVQRYLAREIGHVWPIQSELWHEVGFEPAAFRSFQRELVSVRNLKMRDGLLPLLAEGGVFVAVGALHLLGEDGLVALLQASGYVVTAVD